MVWSYFGKIRTGPDSLIIPKNTSMLKFAYQIDHFEGSLVFTETQREIDEEIHRIVFELLPVNLLYHGQLLEISMTYVL